VKLSRQTRENIKIVAALLIVGILVFVYIVYPLNRSKALMGRENLDTFTEKPLPANDPATYVAAGLKPDTFRVETDGLTNIACLRFAPRDNTKPPRGLVMAVPSERQDRSALAPLVKELVDSGFAVVTYDQRASGASTGKYHGDGQYEAADLEAIIAELDIRKQIHHPLIVAGFAAGADAGLLAPEEEKRIDGVLAVNPYLTTTRLLDQLKARHNAYWFPFFRSMIWWWYNIRSSYAMNFRKTDDIKPVACRTILLTDSATASGPEIGKLKELSPSELLTVKAVQDNQQELIEDIMALSAK
jgi:pimeloyl-ACP methyl ester carboxylesterase